MSALKMTCSQGHFQVCLSDQIGVLQNLEGWLPGLHMTPLPALANASPPIKGWSIDNKLIPSICSGTLQKSPTKFMAWVIEPVGQL